jgi:ribosome recycling factor
LKSFEKEKEITEDERRVGQDQIQKITDKFIKKIDEITAKKEKEILEI